jgi:LAO/AO transport system kinase
VQVVTASLALQTFAEGVWRPPVLKTEAANGAGVDRLWEEIARFRQHHADQQQRRRRASYESRLRDLLAQRLVEHVEKRLPPGEFERLVEAVTARKTDPYTAAAHLMNQALGA